MSTASRPSPTRQPETGLVVELCGLPGAGKSTLAGALTEQLRSQGIDAFLPGSHVSAAAPALPRLFHKAVSVVAVLSADPMAESRAARSLGSGQPSTRDKIAVPVLWWTRKQMLARSLRPGGVAIVDEGLVQALWSARLRSAGAPLSTLIELAESAVRRPDVVVHVDVPHRLAVERLTSRPSRHSRVQRLALEEQLPVMQNGDALLSEILSEWRSHDLSDVVVIDGTAPDCVTRLATDLGQRHSRWPRSR